MSGAQTKKRTKIFVPILMETGIALGIALCFGTWFSRNSLVHGSDVRLILQSFAAALIWLAPALIAVWLLDWGVIRISSLYDIEVSRLQAVRALIPLLLCYLAAFQPVLTYASYGLPLFFLSLAAIVWRQWLKLTSQPAHARNMEFLEEKLRASGEIPVAAIAGGLFFLFILIVISGVFGDLLQPEGDEPHYLVTSYSLMTDGDLQLMDEYKAQIYRRWHRGWVQAHTKAGTGGMEQQYSMHNAGLSVYLVPALAAGLALGTHEVVHFVVRAAMAVPAGMAVFILYLLLVRLFGRRLFALGITTLTATTIPVLFFSYHIFTELPELLVGLTSFFILWRNDSPNIVLRVLLGSLLGLLPWLGVKYLLIAAPFVVLWFVQELRWGWRWGRVIAVATPGALLGIWFFVTTYALFGTFSPSAYYFGA
jgi:hypothetical protein